MSKEGGRKYHVCASTQAVRIRRDQTQSCNLQADLENTSKYCVLGQYEGCSEKGTDFHQTRSNAMILHNTLPASCIEKVVAMNSEEVLCNKIHEAPRSPHKVVLRPAWPEGRKDTSNTDGRKSSATSGKHRETCCRSDEGDALHQIDYRIQGLSQSTVEQQFTQRSGQQVDSSI